jgi:hypothetical protein
VRNRVNKIVAQNPFACLQRTKRIDGLCAGHSYSFQTTS